MTDYIVNGDDLTNIANKIRAKGQTSGSIAFPTGFVNAIDDLPDEPVLELLSVNSNGDYKPENGVDGFSRVIVDVQTGGEGQGAPYRGSTPPTASLGTDGDMYVQTVVGGSISSDGDCYIDSGIIPNSLYCVEIMAALTSNTNGYDTIFGCRNGSAGRFTARFDENVNGQLAVHKSSSPSSNYSFYTSSIRKSDMLGIYYKFTLKDAWYENDILQNAFKSSDVNAFPYSIYVFANNNAGGPSDYAHAKIKYFKVYDNTGALVCYLVGTQDGNGVACMHDLVTGAMKYSGENAVFTYDSSETYVATIYWKKVGLNWQIVGET